MFSSDTLVSLLCELCVWVHAGRRRSGRAPRSLCVHTAFSSEARATLLVRCRSVSVLLCERICIAHCLLISFESAIASGKSALLDELERRGWTTMHEPLGEWTNMRCGEVGESAEPVHVNMLQRYYNTPALYAFRFQCLVMVTMGERERKLRLSHVLAPALVERSVDASYYGAQVLVCAVHMCARSL